MKGRISVQSYSVQLIPLDASTYNEVRSRDLWKLYQEIHVRTQYKYGGQRSTAILGTILAVDISSHSSGVEASTKREHDHGMISRHPWPKLSS